MFSEAWRDFGEKSSSLGECPSTLELVNCGECVVCSYSDRCGSSQWPWLPYITRGYISDGTLVSIDQERIYHLWVLSSYRSPKIAAFQGIERV